VRRLGPLLALALLAACAPRSTRAAGETEYSRVGELELSALVQRDLSDVLGAVDVMNTSRDTVRVEYAGYCALAVLVYPEQGARGWDSSAWWPGQGDCPAGTLSLDLPPRTLGRIVAPVVLAQGIRGDSLPAGSYRAAVRIRLVQPRDTTLVLPAGQIEL
jgi:hypothetical protein